MQELKSTQMYEKVESGRQCQLTFSKRSGATKFLAPSLSYAVALLLLPFLHIVVLWIRSFPSTIWKSAFCHSLLSRHKFFGVSENGKVFQSFSVELGVCHTIYLENWDAFWDTVLHGIQIICLTLNQQKFSTHVLEFQAHIGGLHKYQ